MVLLFLVASLKGATPHLLFHKFYNEFHPNTVDLSTNGDDLTSSDQTNHHQQINRVIELLHSHHYFYSATNKTSKNKDIDSSFDHDDSLEDVEVCTFRLNKMDPFPVDVRVSWLAKNGYGIALVCYHFENRVLAESILRLLLRQMADFCRFPFHPSEILTKPDKVQVVLNKFLPYGELLFMNHRLVRQLERETETAMKGVTN